MWLLRKVRAVGVIALLWFLPWLAGGAAFAVLLLLTSRGPDPLTRPQIVNTFEQTLVVFGLYGACAGLVFAVALAILERNRSIETLRWSRVALSGAIGGGALPLGYAIPYGLFWSSWIPFVLVLVGAALGYMCALATTVLLGVPLQSGATRWSFRRKKSATP